MSQVWDESWLESAMPVERDAWRGVEAQHVVATMRLVDSIQEQELLEQLLDASKPPVPQEAHGLHYLLFTPFRYRAPTSSRFRSSGDEGAFYAADEPATVAAELGYWRWRHLMDSEELREREVVSEHTFFRVRVTGTELDITRAPWNKHRSRWRDPDNYSACQGLASHVRNHAANIATIRYESARREHAMCNVVLQPPALSIPEPNLQQTWTCKTTATRALWAHDRELLEFRQGH